MALTIKRPNGTEDVIPKNIYKWHTVERAAREAASGYGFREIRIPTFENTELFQRSVGETTDVVQKEMYSVIAKETKFTLRPEGTAGTIRALMQNGLLNEAMPQKVFYILSCFRHERPQAGRLREFHQFGVEMAGSSLPSADADIISLASDIINTLGIKNTELKINSIGCPKCRAEYHKALKKYFEDKKDKLCETCQSRLEKNPMRILDCKSPVCSEIAKDAPLILDYLCDECAEHFEKLKFYLDNLDIKYTVDPKIVRGLDYYTKTVFEFVTTDIGAQGTICGGGRYDGLIEQLGGQKTPALGFAMGLERLIITMENQGISFDSDMGCNLYIAPMDDNAVPHAMKLAKSLRDEGFWVEYDVVGRGLKSQMKYSDKLGATFTMVLGDNEITSKKARLKNMKSGEEIEIALDSSFVQNFSNIAVGEMFNGVLEDI
ncbi:histidine--tRNA ligase [Porcipelethomonas sp.]|uniref:histidine--tRNA ligase n=1 Tax=Porcipelethomonas sp. TaxID=2981675 RepID=UPI003EF448D3